MKAFHWRYLVNGSALSFAVLLAGCSTSDHPPTLPSGNTQFTYLQHDMQGRGQHLHDGVFDTVRNITTRLLAACREVDASTPIAVTNLTASTSQYDKASALSYAMSDALMHELYRHDLTVLDFKLSNQIRITPDGDFALSRDFLELADELPIQYVLTGTLVEQDRGFLVNLRLVDAQSRALAGSAQGFVTRQVAESLVDSTAIVDGVRVQ